MPGPRALRWFYRFCLAAGLGVATYQLLRLYAEYLGFPWWDVGVIGCGVLLALLAYLGLRDPARDRDTRLLAWLPGDPPKYIGVLQQVRDFLPSPVPDAWSVSRAFLGRGERVLDTPSERLRVTLIRRVEQSLLRVVIAPRAGATPVADDRCAELLAPFRGVTAWTEIEPYRDSARGDRVWLGSLAVRPPTYDPPPHPPAPRAPELSPHLLAARRHFPGRLPWRWSVPVALTQDNGTGWKDGTWMFRVDGEVTALVSLVTDESRVKLAVTFLWPPDESPNEATALDVLRHFRGITEFVQCKNQDDELPTGCTYLGEIALGDEADGARARRENPRLLN